MLKLRNLPICPNVAAQCGELVNPMLTLPNQSKVGASAEHVLEAKQG